MAADIMAMEGNLVFSSKIDGFESSLTSRIMWDIINLRFQRFYGGLS